MERVPNPERIKEAAITFRGDTFTGITHADAVLKMEEIHPDWFESKEPIEDVFITTTGRLLGREEAGKLARETGQLDLLSTTEREEATRLLDARDLLDEGEGD